MREAAPSPEGTSIRAPLSRRPSGGWGLEGPRTTHPADGVELSRPLRKAPLAHHNPKDGRRPDGPRGSRLTPTPQTEPCPTDERHGRPDAEGKGAPREQPGWTAAASKQARGEGPSRGRAVRGTGDRQRRPTPSGPREGPPREGGSGGGPGGWTGSWREEGTDRGPSEAIRGKRPQGKAPAREGPLPRCRADRAAARRATCRKDRIAEQDEVTSTPPTDAGPTEATAKGQRAGPKESRGTRPRPGSVEPRPVECP